MPCRPFTIHTPTGEVNGFECTREQPAVNCGAALPCVVCGKPHAKLCDGPPGAWPNIKSSSGTCSAPLCVKHARALGERDYCPRHAHLADEPSAEASATLVSAEDPGWKAECLNCARLRQTHGGRIWRCSVRMRPLLYCVEARLEGLCQFKPKETRHE